jgi:hypothetical protein
MMDEKLDVLQDDLKIKPISKSKWYQFNKKEKEGLAITGIITALVSVGFYYFIKIAG